jgi:hypothetical protein
MLYITNAFSLNMLPEEPVLNIQVYSLESDLAARCELINSRYDHDVKSIVGHKDMATLITMALQTPVEFNRETVVLEDGDQLLVAQYTGERLPEGTTALPEGSTITWKHVFVYEEEDVC